jgi:hypothetical protein
MADLNLTKENLPFLLNGAGVLHVSANVPNLNGPIPVSNDDLAQITFSGSGDHTFTIGEADTVQLGIDASTTVRLVPLWSTSAAERINLLQPYDATKEGNQPHHGPPDKLEDYFDPALNHGDRLLLLFLCGGNFDANVDAKFQYTSLSAELTLKAGADASYALLGSCDKNKPAAAAITDFFKELKLPSNIDRPLAPDGMISFGYGGYLNLGATVGVGYEIAGGHTFDIGAMALTEKYDFSLGAKVTVGAKVAGRFNVTAYAGKDSWVVRVVVHKGRQSDITIAADVNVGAKLSEQGLPSSSQDFVSAVLGLKAKNWINLFSEGLKWSDFNTLAQNLDSLAKTYIEQYIGQAFTALQSNNVFSDLMSKFQKVADSYNNVGNDAVTLFDRYFNVATGKVDQQLTDALTKIKAATSWDDLKSNLNSESATVLWEVVNQLTKGDPLGWILAQVKIGGNAVSLDLLKTEVDKVFSLVEDDANAEIRKVIGLAKSEFPLDNFLAQLGGLNWQQLQSLADAKAVGFVERLIGQSLQGLHGSALMDAAKRVNAALKGTQNFTDTTYSKFTEILNQTLQFQLHAGYSRATVNDALIDVELNLDTDKGKQLMKSAGQGDFSEVLQNLDPNIVRINSGTLSDKLTKQSTVSVNITGWHLNWHYESLDQLIVEGDQRMSIDSAGRLIIDTSFNLKDSHQQTRNGERLETNLLLSFIGQSKGKVQFDDRTQRYLVDALTGISARYDLGFDDPDTTPQELAAYLSFADDFGLAESDTAAVHDLAPILMTDAQGHYGHVQINYDVRFTEDGLQSLFNNAFSTTDEAFLQKTARYIVLVNALKASPWLAQIAWCYWSSQAYQVWLALRFTIANTERTFDIDASPLTNVKAPIGITLQPPFLVILDRLFSIEESLIKGMVGLSNLVRSNESFTPAEFEEKLSNFGDALQQYDDQSWGQNATFALFDRLIQRGGGRRNSTLTLTATVSGHTTTKMLIA